jgi:hypothetical protein
MLKQNLKNPALNVKATNIQAQLQKMMIFVERVIMKIQNHQTLQDLQANKS